MMAAGNIVVGSRVAGLVVAAAMVGASTTKPPLG
jgi:hypothetical protein